jgi:CheY-like chemotaxis protein
LLIVDDESDTRELLRRVLEQREASVFLAGDGMTARDVPDRVAGHVGDYPVNRITHAQPPGCAPAHGVDSR